VMTFQKQANQFSEARLSAETRRQIAEALRRRVRQLEEIAATLTSERAERTRVTNAKFAELDQLRRATGVID
jgi:hypothetical protein